MCPCIYSAVLLIHEWIENFNNKGIINKYNLSSIDRQESKNKTYR
jgi:hypothetical protein